MQEAAQKANNLRIEDNESGFWRDGVNASYWDMAIQAAFAGANAANLEEGSLEYGEFVTEFLSQFEDAFSTIESSYDVAMASLLIGQIGSSMMQQCFTEDTFVLTKDGYKQIKDVNVGDYVLSENTDTGEIDYKQVVCTFENESESLIHLFINNVEVKTTSSHPFYVYSKGWT